MSEMNDTIKFISESNLIEGITRPPTQVEINEYNRFMAQDVITLADMIHFVAVCQPDAQLRDRRGLNVQVGNHVPPAGDITIKTRLIDILADANENMVCGIPIWKDAYNIHQRYESLHPFTDGNGRSGRMLWMWMMKEAPLGFLHTWYYQSLQENR